MGNVFYGIPKKIAILAKEKFDIKNYVETGCGIGTDVSWAAMHFDNVYAVEENEAIFTIMKAKTNQFVNVVKLHDNSVQALENILSSLDSPSLFWINDHEPGKECKVIEEIETINKSKYGDVIIVDDASAFGNYGWPTQAKVMMALRDHTRRVAYIEDDAIISRPK